MKYWNGLSDPIILVRNDLGKYEQIQYGETYKAEKFKDVIVIYRKENYLSHEKKLYDLYVWKNGEVQFEKHSANDFLSFAKDKRCFLYATSNMGNTTKYLYNSETNENRKLYTRYIGNIYEAAPDDIIKNDEEYAIKSRYINILFTMGDSIGADILMNFGKEKGYLCETKNIFPYDATDNYSLKINKGAKEDISFVHFILGKVIDVRPKLFGIPLFEFVKFLDELDYNKKYTKEMCMIVEEFKRLKNINSYIEIRKMLSDIYEDFSLKSHSEQRKYLYVNGIIEYDFVPYHYLQYFPNEDLSEKSIRKLSSSMLRVEWKSELRLFLIFRSYYPDAIQHYKAEWLGLQHLDIFIPSIRLAVEYQGEQHYEENPYFGESLRERNYLDEVKRRKCYENKILLLEWPYDYLISEINVIYELRKLGINKIPIPIIFERGNFDVQSKKIQKEKIASKIVRQYGLDGSFLNEYKNAAEASTYTGISAKAIRRAARGEHKSAGGYIWKEYEEGAKIEAVEVLKETHYSNVPVEIAQIDCDTGEIISIYQSIGQAVKTTGINKKSISDVLKGNQRTAGGYFWIKL